MELLKLLSANELVAHALSFLLLLLLMRIFVWKRVFQMLDKRKEKIASGLSRIEKDKEEAAGIKAEYEARLRLVDIEAQKLIEAASQEGKRITEEVRQKAREEAHEIVENARKAVKFELEKARKELRDELVDITIKAAENLIEEKLTVEHDRKLVEDFLQKIEGVE
ncbi:MAG TPA: F0F1 ATP synthase subunit B [Candidatus Margulisiibacteriota bacterium]|nr:F0F1 ATP synthase subunit B [Candidatus Margulisiibacteriota bacterium]